MTNIHHQLRSIWRAYREHRLTSEFLFAAALLFILIGITIALLI